ncbi:MAG: hypothetical protein ROO73_03170 [Roseivirga sp.]
MHKQFNLFITMLLALVLGVGCGKSGDTDKSFDVLKKEAEAKIEAVGDADDVSKVTGDLSISNASELKTKLKNMLSEGSDKAKADANFKVAKAAAGKAAAGKVKDALDAVVAALEKAKK